MFKEIKLCDKYPFSKLYMDTYKDSYYKVLRESIDEEEVLESTFLKLTKKKLIMVTAHYQVLQVPCSKLWMKYQLRIMITKAITH